MKFTKGLLIGSMLTAGVMMVYSDNQMSTKKMIKKGKQWARKMGMV